MFGPLPIPPADTDTNRSSLCHAREKESNSSGERTTKSVATTRPTSGDIDFDSDSGMSSGSSSGIDECPDSRGETDEEVSGAGAVTSLGAGTSASFQAQNQSAFESPQLGDKDHSDPDAARSSHNSAGRAFPHNVIFRTADWARDGVFDDREGWDVILA